MGFWGKQVVKDKECQLMAGITVGVSGNAA